MFCAKLSVLCDDGECRYVVVAFKNEAHFDYHNDMGFDYLIDRINDFLVDHHVDDCIEAYSAPVSDAPDIDFRSK